jgi:signal peptidase I
MEPNFVDGEYLLTDKITYRLREPERGDVVVFEAPGANGEEFIKRIIGLPGEIISVREGIIYINGQLLAEQYIPETFSTEGGSFLRDGTEVNIPEGNYFVMGDNRAASYDSRSWGFITKDKITGRAWLVYWPPAKAGILENAEFSSS